MVDRSSIKTGSRPVSAAGPGRDPAEAWSCPAPGAVGAGGCPQRTGVAM